MRNINILLSFVLGSKSHLWPKASELMSLELALNFKVQAHLGDIMDIMDLVPGHHNKVLQ